MERAWYLRLLHISGGWLFRFGQHRESLIYPFTFSFNMLLCSTLTKYLLDAWSFNLTQALSWPVGSRFRFLLLLLFGLSLSKNCWAQPQAPKIQVLAVDFDHLHQLYTK